MSGITVRLIPPHDIMIAISLVVSFTKGYFCQVPGTSAYTYSTTVVNFNLMISTCWRCFFCSVVFLVDRTWATWGKHETMEGITVPVDVGNKLLRSLRVPNDLLLLTQPHW